MSKIRFKKQELVGVASYKDITKKAVPIIVMMMFSTMIPMVDNIMVGLIGDQALSALGFSSTLIFVQRIMLMGLTSGAGIMLGQYLGRGKLDKVQEAFRFRLTLSLGWTLPFLFLALFGAEPYMKMWTHDAGVIKNGSEYLHWMAPAFVIGAISGQYGGASAQIGKAMILMILSLVSVATNCVLDYVFIRVVHWGIKGVALATLFVQTGMMLAMYCLNWGLKTPIHTNVFKIFIISKEVIVNSFKRWHTLVTEIVFTLSISAGQLIIARAYIDSAGAVGAIRASVDPFARIAMAGFIGASSTISYFVGTRLGASDFKSAQENAKRLLRVGLTFMFILSSLLAITSQWVMEIYTDVGDDVKRQGAMYLRFLPLVNLFIAYSAMKSRILEIGGQTKAVMVWDFWYNVAFIGLAAVICYAIHLPDDYIWATLALVNTIRILKCVYIWYLYRQNKWLTNLTLTKEEQEALVLSKGAQDPMDVEDNLDI